MFGYAFPTKDGIPVGLGNLRQSVTLDMRNGYFSNNPRGLWVRVWLGYADRACNTSGGRKTLEARRKRNGASRDGTPIIETPAATILEAGQTFDLQGEQRGETSESIN